MKLTRKYLEKFKSIKERYVNPIDDNIKYHLKEIESLKKMKKEFEPIQLGISILDEKIR
jgi:hypothetical protein